MSRALGYGLKSIGIIVFLFLLSRVDFAQFMNNLRQADAALIGIAFFLFPVIYLIKSWRWHLLTHAVGVRAPLMYAVRVYSASLFLGIITPGRIGEAAKIPALRAQGVSLRHSIIVTVADRLIDLTFLGALGLIAAGVLYGRAAGALFLAAVGGVCVLSFFWKKLRLPTLKEINELLHGRLTGVALSTVLNWIVFIVQMLLLAEAFSIEVPLLPLGSSIVLTAIVVMLPIAPAGLGTREAGLLAFLAPFGVDPSRIIAYAFVTFILTLLASLIGAYFWIRFPLAHKSHAG